VSVSFLARASREYTRGGWVFTGFHWPVLAGETAARLEPTRFAQIFEAGASSHGPAGELPTSTTDYAALGRALVWRGTTADVLGAVIRKADRVVLDAANVDVSGCVNATAIGPYGRPRVRLPGGGGAADAAAGARELVLLHGAPTPERIVARVEHVTARPAPGARVRLITQWGVIELHGERPRLTEVDWSAPRAVEALEHLRALGVALDDAAEWSQPSDAELRAAARVMQAAADRGYVVAGRPPA
jgi:glutaconate CoA-transferase subunit B